MLSPDRFALAAPSPDLPFELVFELAGAGLCVVGPAGQIVALNREWARIAGVTREDAMGRAIVDVLPDPALGADLEAAWRGGEVEVPRRRLAIDHEEFWWEGRITSVPLGDGTGLLVTARDATIDAAQECAAERAVRGQSRLAHTLIEAVPAGIALLEPPHFRVRWANAAAQQFLDEAYRSGSIAGRTVSEIVPGAEASGLIRHLRRVVATGVPFEVPEFAFDGFARGQTFWRWSAHPLPREDRQADVMVVAVEITEQGRARQRAERAAARARAAAGWLEALQELTGALASTRTPREVAGVLAARAVKAVGARAFAIGRLQGSEMVFDLHGGYPADALSPYRLPAGDGVHGALIRDLRPMWFGSGEEMDGVFPGRRWLRERLGIRAWVGLPLLVGDRVIGALSFAFDAPREFGEAERSFHLALAQQCAQVLDRAFVLEREQALRARLTFGYELAAALASARSLDEVVRTVLDRGIPAFGARAGFVAVPIEASERAVRILGHGAPGAEEIAAWPRIAAEHPAAARALDLGEPVWLGSRQEALARFPSWPAQDGRSAAWAAIPLAAEGRRLGVLALSFAGEQGFDLSDRAAILSLAGASAQALDRVRLDEAERAARREAEAARSESERVGRLQEQLFAVVGHDLRTPLCAMVAGVHVLLQRSDLPDPAVRTLERIRSSARRMTDMIRDLLDLSRARQGLGIPVERAPVDLGALVRRVLQEFQATQPDRIHLEVCDEILVLGDGSRLAQVIANLVGNALQHGDPSAPVRVRATSGRHGAILEVHNHGSVPAAVLPNVFEPFRQAGGGAGGGIGLGLYISREIVRAHGGEIAIRSTAADGTTVEVGLPRHGR